MRAFVHALLFMGLLFGAMTAAEAQEEPSCVEEVVAYMQWQEVPWYAWMHTFAELAVWCKDPEPDECFHCDTLKRCSEMTSCEEALHQLQECGNTRIDGDRDGIPCEALCVAG